MPAFSCQLDGRRDGGRIAEGVGAAAVVVCGAQTAFAPSAVTYGLGDPDAAPGTFAISELQSVSRPTDADPDRMFSAGSFRRLAGVSTDLRVFPTLFPTVPSMSTVALLTHRIAIPQGKGVGGVAGKRRRSPSHGENRGSSPLGSAKEIKDLDLTRDVVSNKCPIYGRGHRWIALSVTERERASERRTSRVLGSRNTVRSGENISGSKVRILAHPQRNQRLTAELTRH